MAEYQTNPYKLKAVQVRSIIEADIEKASDQQIKDCYDMSKELWLKVIVDPEDQHRFFTEDMITAAQICWEKRIDLFACELRKRGLDGKEKT